MSSTFDLLSGVEIDDAELEQLRVSYVRPAASLLSDKLFLRYSTSAAAWRDQAKQDEDFRNGAQWTDESKKRLLYRKQRAIVVNVIKPAVEQAKAHLTSNRPRFSSSAREDSDVRTGKMFSELMSYIWDVSDGDVMHKLIIDDYYVKGMGAWFIDYDAHADFGKGEIFLRSLDPYELFIDPNAKDPFARDAAHMLIVRILTGEQIQQSFPTDAKRVFAIGEKTMGTMTPGSLLSGDEGQTLIQDDYEAWKYRAIDRYSRVKIRYVHVYKPSDGTEKILVLNEAKKFFQQGAFIEKGVQDVRYITEADEVQQTAQLYQQTGGIYHYIIDPTTQQPVMQPGPESEGDEPGSTRILIPTTNGALLKQGVFTVNEYYENRIQRTLTIGGVLVYEGVMPISQYPIVPVMNHFMRNPYPMSDVRFVRSIQELINKTQSLILLHAANSANVKVLLPEGSQKVETVERQLAKPGIAVATYNAELGAPTIGQPIPMPAELYRTLEQGKADIERILGIYEFMQGGGGSAPQTYKGTVAIDEMSQRRIRSKQADIEAALIQAAKVVVEMIQAYYTEHKVVRILEPNHKPRQMEINVPIYDTLGEEVTGYLNDVTVGKYDIVLISGSMLPNNRWARFDYYVQLFQLGVIDQIELLKQTEVVDIEDVLNRHSQMAQAQQQIEALTEQVKNLQGDLQTANREGVQDRKRVEVEKFKTKLNDTASRSEAAGTVFQKQLASELAQMRRVNAYQTANRAQELRDNAEA